MLTLRLLAVVGSTGKWIPGRPVDGVRRPWVQVQSMRWSGLAVRLESSHALAATWLGSVNGSDVLLVEGL